MRVFVALLIAASVGAAALPRPAGVAAAPAAGAQRYVIDPDASQVIYRVGEVLLNQGNRFNVAVGVTKVVRGEVVIDRARPRDSRVGTISVGIREFTSDSSRRDNAIRDRWLESNRYPVAEFTPTRVEGLPEAYADGREVALRITGDLKIRDVTRSTTFATTLALRGDTLTGVGMATIRMTDFGFDPPSILGILRAENEARLEMRFTARRAP